MKLREWIDEQIYFWSFRAINRWLRRNPGFLYLFELRLRSYREENPDKFPQKMMSAAEGFNDSLSRCALNSERPPRTTNKTLKLVNLHQ